MRSTVAFGSLLIVAGTAVLAACNRDTSELQSYIERVKARPGAPVEPLPEIRPAPTFSYEASDGRSPFMPGQQQARARDNPDAVEGPDPDRPREFLEQFPLDTLDMVGTLTIQGATFGLVQTSSGLIERVRTGNHMGQNYGRITNISESRIELVEIVPDGLGGYRERPAGVRMSD